MNRSGSKPVRRNVKANEILRLASAFAQEELSRYFKPGGRSSTGTAMPRRRADLEGDAGRAVGLLAPAAA